MFALREGRVVGGAADALAEVDGLVGQRDYSMTAIGLSLDSTQVAGVSGKGTSILVGPTYDPEGTVLETVSGATDLLRAGVGLRRPDVAGRPHVPRRAG